MIMAIMIIIIAWRPGSSRCACSAAESSTGWSRTNRCSSLSCATISCLFVSCCICLMMCYVCLSCYLLLCVAMCCCLLLQLLSLLVCAVRFNSSFATMPSGGFSDTKTSVPSGAAPGCSLLILGAALLSLVWR